MNQEEREQIYADMKATIIDEAYHRKQMEYHQEVLEALQKYLKELELLEPKCEDTK